MQPPGNQAVLKDRAYQEDKGYQEDIQRWKLKGGKFTLGEIRASRESRKTAPTVLNAELILLYDVTKNT